MQNHYGTWTFFCSKKPPWLSLLNNQNAFVLNMGTTCFIDVSHTFSSLYLCTSQRNTDDHYKSVFLRTGGIWGLESFKDIIKPLNWRLWQHHTIKTVTKTLPCTRGCLSIHNTFNQWWKNLGKYFTMLKWSRLCCN